MDASLKGNTKINFNAVGMSEIKMDGNAEIHLYHLVQEGLSNIRKHAEAGNANIVLLRSYPYIILRIDDDGKGFDMMQQEIMSASYKRMGIRSMHERVNLLNGQMTLQSHPMKGTHIFIKIPIAKKPV